MVLSTSAGDRGATARALAASGFGLNAADLPSPRQSDNHAQAT